MISPVLCFFFKPVLNLSLNLKFSSKRSLKASAEGSEGYVLSKVTSTMMLIIISGKWLERIAGWEVTSNWLSR